MGKRKKNSKLDKAKVIAWKFYIAWRKTGSASPAFDNEIIWVSRLGWNHLVSPRKHRTQQETLRRLKALPLAKKIIETSTTYQEYRKDRDITYWAFIAYLDSQKIKVVVSSRNKKKYFLSVILMK